MTTKSDNAHSASSVPQQITSPASAANSVGEPPAGEGFLVRCERCRAPVFTRHIRPYHTTIHAPGHLVLRAKRGQFLYYCTARCATKANTYYRWLAGRGLTELPRYEVMSRPWLNWWMGYAAGRGSKPGEAEFASAWQEGHAIRWGEEERVTDAK